MTPRKDLQQQETACGMTCPICHLAQARQNFAKDSYPVYLCGNCRCEFLEPQPDDRKLEEIYSAHYFLGDHSEESDQRISEMKTATANLYLDRLAKAFPTKGARFLEIGCGTGDLLVQAQSRSLEVHGVEFSTISAATANQRLGAELVQPGTIENSSLPIGHFDVIAACDVIEHTRSPRSFLERAYALLRPGGLIFLVTPSLDSWSRKLLGKRWMDYKVEHLFYFGRTSLARLLADTGFEQPIFEGNRKVLTLDYVYHHFDRFTVPGLTPLFRLARRLAPERLALRHWILPASGIFVTARKPAVDTSKINRGGVASTGANSTPAKHGY